MKTSQLIKDVLRCLYKQVFDIPKSNIRLKRQRRKRSGTNSNPIKVGFVVQMPELWDKQKAVFNLMLENQAFDPWLIIVPAFDNTTNTIGNYGKEKDFFVSESKGNYYLAKENNKWRMIQDDKFEYLFYQRPYENYLPEPLRSKNTSKYLKICYIPYATPEMKNTSVYPYSFFKNLYFGFLEDENAAEYNRSRYHDKRGERFLNLGYPPFQKCLLIKNRCNYKNILWTPRWSYAPIGGGSHFFEYVNQLSEYHWGLATFTVRPHPMMWNNFLKEGRVDSNEIDEIIDKWNQNNIRVDNNKEIETTFESTDILISDISSVIAMFFLTGKPIIYCEYYSDYSYEYGELFNSLIPGLYVVSNWDELNQQLSELLKENDIKKDIRNEIIKKRFMYHKIASESIVKHIYNDAKKDCSE